MIRIVWLMVASLGCAVIGYATPVSIGTVLFGEIGQQPAGSVGLGTTQFLAQQFTVFDPTDVNVVYVNLYLPGGPTTVTDVTLWITDKIGPGTSASDLLYKTSFASDNVLGQVPEVMLAITAIPDVPLAPGNYFLVLSSAGTLPDLGGGGSNYFYWATSSPYSGNTGGVPDSGFYACCAVGMSPAVSAGLRVPGGGFCVRFHSRWEYGCNA
jgi:hypothetical protein